MKLTDYDRMPASLPEHAGKMMKDVPADYLLWLYDQEWAKKKFSDICEYVEANRKCLDWEQERTKKGRRI